MRLAFLILVTVSFSSACHDLESLSCDDWQLVDHQPSPTTDDCYITGCSGELCADEPTFSACVWWDEYVCFRSAICTRQDNGVCGWTATEEFEECLESCRS